MEGEKSLSCGEKFCNFYSQNCISGVIIQAVSLLLLAFVSPGHQFVLFLLLMVCTVFGLSIYDTTTDGLAIRFLKKTLHCVVHLFQSISEGKQQESLVQVFMGIGNALGSNVSGVNYINPYLGTLLSMLCLELWPMTLGGDTSLLPS